MPYQGPTHDRPPDHRSRRPHGDRSRATLRRRDRGPLARGPGGRGTLFGYPGGAVLPIYDALFHAERACATCWSATSRGRPTPPRAMRARPASRAWSWSPRAPGATNAITGHRRRPDGLGSAGDLITGQVADPPDRHRRLPGGGHHRHHAALHQAQLPGQGRMADLPRIMHEAFHVAPQRPAGPGGRRPAQGRDGQGQLSGTRGLRPARPTTTRRSRATAARIAEAVELIAGAKRPLFYTGGGVINSGPRASKAAAGIRQADRLSR